MAEDDRPFVKGSTVKVTGDDCGIHPVRMGTVARIITSRGKASEIAYTVGTVEERSWLWNRELQLIEGARIDAHQDKARGLAKHIVDAILVHGFENDADAEKVLRNQEPLLAMMLERALPDGVTVNLPGAN